MEIREVVKERLSERDEAFRDVLRRVKNDMNARGLLHSGETVKRGFEALVQEFRESRTTIVETISELCQLYEGSRPSIFESQAIEWLEDRKSHLEQFYLEQMKVIVDRLTNKAMLRGYHDLSSVAESQINMTYMDAP